MGGGNAADAAIAMAAMVNVTEPMMNGLGGDAFILVYWQGKLHGLNASGRCPQTITRRTEADAADGLGQCFGARRARRLFCAP
jgi:gamma-glutamyltranspeptidase